MSRIGKRPIKLNIDISIKIENNKIIIKGPKGELTYTIPKPIKVTIKEYELTIQTTNNNKISKELHGLSRTIINNMLTGVSEGFNKILEIQGVGYRAQVDNKNTLILNVGYSHPIRVEAPKDVKIQVENNNRIIIQGINKAIVGQIASQIRAIRPPEPYKGKGIRYQNEIIKKKVGKAGK